MAFALLVAVAAPALGAEAQAAGNARVYAQNPARTPVPSVVAMAAPPTGTTLSSPGLSAWSCVDEGRAAPVVAAGITRSLHACVLRQVARADAAGDFLFDPPADPGAVATDAFAETSAYVHAARAVALFRALGGAEPPIARVDRPLAVIASFRYAEGLDEGDFTRAAEVARPLAPFGGAFFLQRGPGPSPESDALRVLTGASTDAVSLGVGPSLSFAYDADVVVHETTHALLHATVGVAGFRLAPRGLTVEPEALSEGLSDYFAAVAAGTPLLGEYVTRATGAADATRAIDRRVTCSEAVGESHADGVIVSSALWEARATLKDPTLLDAAVYRALLPADPHLSFAAFGARVIAALGPGPAALVVARALDERGVTAQGCAPIPELRAAQSVTSSGGGFVAPGTRRLASAAVRAAIAPGVAQLRALVPPGARRVRIRFSGATTAPALFAVRGTDFAPRLLAKWDAPIAFAAAGGDVTHDASFTAVAERSGASFEGTLDVDAPAAARTIYVAIANAGEADGAYDAITVAFDDAPAPADAAVDGPSADGSGCSASRSTTKGDEGFVALVALAAVVRRRRRDR